VALEVNEKPVLLPSSLSTEVREPGEGEGEGEKEREKQREEGEAE
jgi:hypothetical protein